VIQQLAMFLFDQILAGRGQEQICIEAQKPLLIREIP
jgi:hypothetical protein